MVRWPGVMWLRLTLTLLLASAASSGSSACPEACQCSRVSSKEPPINPDEYERTEIHCTGKTPRIGSLPEKNVGRLVVEGTEPYAITNMLRNFATLWASNNTGVKSLEELAIINCSLPHLNMTSRDTNGLSVRKLNLSDNLFTETRALRIDSEALKRLERLDLSSNRLGRVRREAFVNFSSLVQLTLRRNIIRVVEEGAFTGLGVLENLDLSENRLATLREDAFVPLYFLQKLDLSGNELRALDGRWFDSLGRLRELDVSRNRFASSQVSALTADNKVESKPDDEATRAGALEALPFGLTVLRLADNPLMVLELSLVLGSGRRLETVDASRIGLDRVPPALTRSVRVLILSGNKLTTIRSGDFDSYPLLRLLDLSNNSLRVVEEDALGRLEVLEKLDLSGNRLTELPQSLPGSLVNLVIRYNSISRLTPKDLQGLSKLEGLFIDSNTISEIEEGSMSQLTLLTELDVSDNPLKQLPANTFGGPRSLVVLRMSGLVSLEWEREKRADMAFPVPAPERLVSLDLSRSPALAAQLLADEAALSACKSLRRLNLARTNLTTLRSDLAYLLPQLHTLGLSDNEWNCTSANADLYWIVDWIKQHEEINPPARCADTSSIREDGRDVILAKLPNYRTPFVPASSSPPTSSSSSSSFKTTETIAEPRNSDQAEERQTTLEHIRLKSLPNNSHSYTIDTDSITATSTSVSLERDYKYAQVRSTTDSPSIQSNALITGTEEDYENDELPELPTIRTTNSIILLGEKKGNSPSFVDDNSVAARKMDLIGAEQLIGSDETSKSVIRGSRIDFIVREHPGMLVVVAGATLGVLATLTIVLSRRLGSTLAGPSVVITSQEQQPIITELW